MEIPRKRLGTVGPTVVWLATTDEPWQLPGDAVVVSVGGGTVGNFGRALRRYYGKNLWDAVDLERARVRIPALVRGEDRGSWFVLATLYDGPEDAQFADNIPVAVAAVVRRCRQLSGCRSMLIPLLGAGALGLGADQSARRLVPALQDALRDWPGLEEVGLVARTPGEAQAIEQAWTGEGTSPALTRTLISDRAQGLLRAAREFDGTVTGPALLLALIERGFARDGLAADTGTGFLDEIAADRSAPLSETSFGLRRHLEQWRPERAAERALLEIARDTAVSTDVVGEIHLRHLLAAVSLTEMDSTVYDILGVSAFDLRRHLFTVVSAMVLTDPAEKWRRILLEGELPGAPRVLAGGIARDLVDPRRGIPLADDHLGVGVYAEMFASVIASPDTPTPLSVGLFGEWGSGKSSFMGLLRRQIDERCEAGDSYLRNIVQIGFNAWSYADTNLWASLGEEIFRQLSGTGEPETPDRRRAALNHELALSDHRVAELLRARSTAQAQTARLRAELDQVQGERQDSLLDLVQAADAELAPEWRRLGITDERERVHVLAEQIRGTTSDAVTLARALTGRRGRALAVLALFSGIVLLVGLFGELWLAGGGIAGLTVVTGLITTHLATARAATARLAGFVRNLDRAGDRRVEQARERLRNAEADEQVLLAEYEQMLSRAGELGRELAELSPGRRLYGFLAERAGSDDYRGNLGLISTVRRDFEQLSRLMRDWDPAAHDGVEKPIDRIVLYIDDLDRCTPKQVVAVLEAVHLLLALDLFVVVVGVDVRRLVQSVRQEGRAALGTSAPDDYLKKIFNIPFVLPALEPAGFRAMIGNLSGPSPRPAPMSRPTAPVPAAEPETPVVQPESEVDRVRRGRPGEPEPLTDREKTLLYDLAPLVRSPREAKRLLNLYRMLRSTQNLSEASSFLGTDDEPGEYQAVATLLGLLTAGPARLEAVLDVPPDPEHDLVGGIRWRSPAPGTWPETLRNLRPRLVGEHWCNDLRWDLPDGDRRDWADLVERATPAAKHVTLPDLDAFRRWGPRVTRFTFGR